MESVPPVVEAWNLNHWTTRHIPDLSLFTCCELLRIFQYIKERKKKKKKVNSSTGAEPTNITEICWCTGPREQGHLLSREASPRLVPCPPAACALGHRAAPCRAGSASPSHSEDSCWWHGWKSPCRSSWNTHSTLWSVRCSWYLSPRLQLLEWLLSCRLWDFGIKTALLSETRAWQSGPFNHH